MSRHDNHEHSKLIAMGKFSELLFSGIRSKEKDLWQIVYSHIGTLIDTENLYIAIYEELSDTIRFCQMSVDGIHLKTGEQGGWQTRKAGRDRIEEVIRSGKPLFHPTKSDTESWYRQRGDVELVSSNISSWMGAPMMSGGKVLGMIAVYHMTEEHKFNSQDLEILQTIANLIALALENLRFYQEARSEVIPAKQLSTLGTAMAALQHRINNSFNVIIPNVTRLKSRVDLNDPTIVEILDIIERNARYTSEIIARIQEPLKEVEITDININAILEAIVLKKQDSWKSHVTSPKVTLSFNADERIPIVRGLSGQIAEVFENLMDNGYKAMPKGGEIEVRSKLSNGNIMVRVKDTGKGIPQEIQDRLFVRPVPSKNPGSGAGLGLWLSRLMLQSIGGDIKIESSNSTGTVMLVIIPVDEDRKES